MDDVEHDSPFMSPHQYEHHSSENSACSLDISNQTNQTNTDEKKRKIDASPVGPWHSGINFGSTIRSTAAEVSDNRKKKKIAVVPQLLSPTLPSPNSGPILPRLLSPTLPLDIEKDLVAMNVHEFQKPIPSKKYAFEWDSRSTSKSIFGHSPFSLAPRNEARDSLSKNPVNISAAYNHENIREPPSTEDGLWLFRESNTSKAMMNGFPTFMVKLHYGRTNINRVKAIFKSPRREESDIPMERSGSNSNLFLSNESKITRNPLQNEAGMNSFTCGKQKIHKTIPGSSKKHVPFSHSSRDPLTQQLLPIPPTDMHSTLPKSEVQPKSPSSYLKLVQGDNSTSSIANSWSPDGTSLGGTNELRNIASGNVKRNALKDEFQKYHKLGRDLKHISQRYTRPISEDSINRDEKRGAAVGVESILCFIIAFVIDDKMKCLSGQVGDSANWRSMLAYWQVVEKRTLAFPHLHGLCCILGAVSHDSIHNLDLECLAKISFPLHGQAREGPENSCTGFKSSKKAFIDVRNRLLDSNKGAVKLWLKGTRQLSDEILSENYPSTWSRRCKDFDKRRDNDFRPGNYSGPFFLPMGPLTTPLEAVRFAFTFLREWTANNDLNWNSSLDL